MCCSASPRCQGTQSAQQHTSGNPMPAPCCPCGPCAGAPMVPISWQEMQCPKTKAVEKRKVAKVSL